MDRNKVSVITVCFNAAKTIEATMLSVLNQTYENMEYIIIDGGSTDGTQEIIEKILTSLPLTPYPLPRCVWFSSEPDKGIYDAMNKGLAHAEGDWVSFMNAGDTFADERVLEDVFSYPLPLTSYLASRLPLTSYPLPFTSTDIRVIYGGTIDVFSDHEELRPIGSPAMIEYDIPFTHQATFTRLNPEEPWRFNLKYRISADYNLFHSIYKAHGEKAFLQIDRTICRFDRTDSFSHSHFRAAKREYLRIQRAWTKFWWWNEWKRLWLGIYK